MLNDVLPSFCQTVSEVEEEKEIYCRIKVGKNRRRSDVVISGIAIHDAGQLCDELEGRLLSLSPEEDERIYVEAMVKGSSSCFDCLHLKPKDLVSEDDLLDDDIMIDPMAASFASLTAVVERLAVSADTRASQAHERLLTALTSILELQAIGIEAETRLELVEEQKSDNAMSEAASVFGPLVPLVVERFTAQSAVQQSKEVVEKVKDTAAIPLTKLPETAAKQAADVTNDASPEG